MAKKFRPVASPNGRWRRTSENAKDQCDKRWHNIPYLNRRCEEKLGWWKNHLPWEGYLSFTMFFFFGKFHGSF